MTTILLLLLLYYEHLSESLGHYIDYRYTYIFTRSHHRCKNKSNKQTVNYDHVHKFETYCMVPN